jgi:hypothetical protein
MMIQIPGRPARLPFHAPEHACCNCGTADGVQLIDTRLKQAHSKLLAGTEMTFMTLLPYCGICKASARRSRRGKSMRGLTGFSVFWVLFGVMTLIGNEHLPHWLAEYRIGLAALVATALTSAYYLLRRARPPQTSYYQPIYLRQLQQSARGEVQSITLGFTNAAYAEKYSAHNATFRASGALQVEVG